MDNYIHICNLWVILAALENVLFPVVGFDSSGRELFNEWYVLLMFLSSFLAVNVVFWFRVKNGIQSRREGAQKLLQSNETARRSSPPVGEKKQREIRRFASLMAAPVTAPSTLGGGTNM